MVLFQHRDRRRLGAAEGLASVRGDLANAVEQLFAYFVGVRADRELQLHFVGNDIVLRAAVDRAHRDDRPFQWIKPAADDGLQTGDDVRGGDDRIDGHVRPGAVPASAENRDVHRVHVGKGPTGRVANVPDRQIMLHVQRDAEIRLGKTLEQSVFDHHAGALSDFFRRLGDQNDAASPLRAEFAEQSGGAHQHGAVYVVAAGVHDAHLGAVVFADPHFADVVQPGLFDDGQGVHVAADEHGRPVAVGHHRHHARAADAGGDLVAVAFETLCQQGGGFEFL